MQKTAVVTGVTGQDGAYLTGLLLEKGYRVFGTFRRSSSVNFWRLKQLELYNAPGLELVEHDVTDLSSSFRLIQKTNPDEVYNLAAQSFVGVSFDQPVTTGEINAFGVLNLLEAIRLYKPNTKFYQASTSEMFGKVQSVPQNENTPFYPRSPYGVAKLYAHWISINYRESYGIFACSGILFNHESPLRGLEFVTRKITDAVARIKLGLLETLELGNLSARRDWGYAREYVAGMWQMMQAEEPGTFVLSSGRSESVRDFVSMAFQTVGFSIDWQGRNDSETGICRENGQTVVKVTPKFYRPAEVDLLIGDSAKARQILGWQANTTLEDLCKMMVESDLARLENTAAIQ